MTRRNALLDDIAILTGGRMIAEELSIKLENVTFEDTGRAKRITVDKGQHDDHRRRRQEEGHRRPHQADPQSGQGGDVRRRRERLQERLAA